MNERQVEAAVTIVDEYLRADETLSGLVYRVKDTGVWTDEQEHVIGAVVRLRLIEPSSFSGRVELVELGSTSGVDPSPYSSVMVSIDAREVTELIVAVDLTTERVAGLVLPPDPGATIEYEAVG